MTQSERAVPEGLVERLRAHVRDRGGLSHDAETGEVVLPEPWHDIATAPKDGDDILVTDARLQGGFPQVVYWDDSPVTGWHLADSDVVYHSEAFTHWRRDCLAPPPEGSRANLADATPTPLPANGGGHG